MQIICFFSAFGFLSFLSLPHAFIASLYKQSDVFGFSEEMFDSHICVP